MKRNRSAFLIGGWSGSESIGRNRKSAQVFHKKALSLQGLGVIKALRHRYGTLYTTPLRRCFREPRWTLRLPIPS